MSVIISTRAARPPQPSWRIRWRMSRSIIASGAGMCVSAIMRILPQRSHSMRRNQDGNTYGQTGSSAIAKASVPMAVNESPTLTRFSAACRWGSVTLKVCTIPPDGFTSEIV